MLASMPTVLIIDDNATNRLILSEMLSRWGAVVTAAEGGQQGMTELLRAESAGSPYALVLLDRRMPGVDGFEVAEAIHRHPTMAGTTILMLTSENRAGDIARGRTLGERRQIRNRCASCWPRIRRTTCC